MAESASSAPPESMHAASASSGARPRSAVSAGVGIVGLAGLVSYLLIARFAPEIAAFLGIDWGSRRSEEHTSELQSLMRISYAVFCLKKKTNSHTNLSITRH